MKKTILVVVMLLFALDTLVLADLTNIQGSVYRTGSGADSLYWYLNMNNLVNHTWNYQEWYATNLEVNIEGIEDNWHIASKQELDQLLVFGDQPHPQNTLVANVIGVNEGPPEYATYARYNETWTVGGSTNHYNTSFDFVGGDWKVGRTGAYWDNDIGDAIGAWVVTESAPYIRAEAGGPYIIDVGETVLLDNSSSYSNCGIDEIYWRIDDQIVGASVSYDELVSGLGLTTGTYEVELQAGGGGVYDYGYSTIEIVPEPATLLLFGLGAVMLRKKR